MKIAMLTYGSRGDVQPYLALALGLQKAGHSILLAAPHRFADSVPNSASLSRRCQVTRRF
jgi:sterol 3beta-glucosyltransferase